MRLDVSKLKSHGDSEEFEFCETWEKIEFRGDTLFFVEPVIFYGIATKKGNVIEVSGNIRTKLKTTCYRCTEDAFIEVDVPFYEEYSNKVEVRDDDVIQFENEVIEFDENVIATIVLYLPMKYLCKEDCKGLCPICGTNLNFNSCSCEKNEIDPRLSVLKTLINELDTDEKKEV
ncbi:protein of unknown function DUF177 [Caldicellulosiruptor saccharolyticus DSM 8903]|uniref:DUF177 domain-containing protein n=1 Tax=Caldicellulosiruptor saccharolyticus (strain ATCC 43494 / DSM 8903 / Tp8T 6331) TaxID=351627 RepID=A4XKH3_CALS8|nr:DUF177 domain-containing protein [Caldicellulosiruptor saccharolyticus]ABP67408.1 protein of unknown function DUF177 [Caldicellulosiruptor saccharolyticus DSM 8903]